MITQEELESLYKEPLELDHASAKELQKELEAHFNKMKELNRYTDSNDPISAKKLENKLNQFNYMFYLLRKKHLKEGNAKLSIAESNWLLFNARLLKNNKLYENSLKKLAGNKTSLELNKSKIEKRTKDDIKMSAEAQTEIEKENNKLIEENIKLNAIIEKYKELEESLIASIDQESLTASIKSESDEQQKEKNHKLSLDSLYDYYQNNMKRLTKKLTFHVQVAKQLTPQDEKLLNEINQLDAEALHELKNKIIFEKEFHQRLREALVFLKNNISIEKTNLDPMDPLIAYESQKDSLIKYLTAYFDNPKTEEYLRKLDKNLEFIDYQLKQIAQNPAHEPKPLKKVIGAVAFEKLKAAQMTAKELQKTAHHSMQHPILFTNSQPITKMHVQSKVHAKHMRGGQAILLPEEVHAVRRIFMQHPNLIKLSRTRGKREKEQSLSSFEKNLELPFSVVKTNNGRLIALYEGDNEHILGKGYFGKVKLGQDIETGEWLAIKIQIEKSENEEEVAIGTEMGNFKGVLSREGKQYIAQELLGKELSDYIETEDQQEAITKVQDKFTVALSILEGVKELHEKNIIHRDLKPRNVTLDRVHLKAKLIDFGLSKKTDNDLGNYQSVSLQGTLDMLPPESLLRKSPDKFKSPDDKSKISSTKMYSYNKAGDMYSYAKILYSLFSGTTILPKPYEQFRVDQAINDGNLQKEAIDEMERYKNGAAPSFPKALAKALGKSTDDPLVKSLSEFLEKMTDNEPERRPTADEAFKELRQLANTYSNSLSPVSKP